MRAFPLIERLVSVVKALTGQRANTWPKMLEGSQFAVSAGFTLEGDDYFRHRIAFLPQSALTRKENQPKLCVLCALSD